MYRLRWRRKRGGKGGAHEDDDDESAGAVVTKLESVRKWVVKEHLQFFKHHRPSKSLHPDDVMHSICAHVRSRLAVALHCRICDVGL